MIFYCLDEMVNTLKGNQMINLMQLHEGQGTTILKVTGVAGANPTVESKYFPTLKYIGMAEGKFNTHKLGSQREHMIQQDTKILTNDTARY